MCNGHQKKNRQKPTLYLRCFPFNGNKKKNRQIPVQRFQIFIFLQKRKSEALVNDLHACNKTNVMGRARIKHARSRNHANRSIHNKKNRRTITRKKKTDDTFEWTKIQTVTPFKSCVFFLNTPGVFFLKVCFTQGVESFLAFWCLNFLAGKQGGHRVWSRATKVAVKSKMYEQDVAGDNPVVFKIHWTARADKKFNSNRQETTAASRLFVFAIARLPSSGMRAYLRTWR